MLKEESLSNEGSSPLCEAKKEGDVHTTKLGGPQESEEVRLLRRCHEALTAANAVIHDRLSWCHEGKMVRPPRTTIVREVGSEVYNYLFKLRREHDRKKMAHSPLLHHDGSAGGSGGGRASMEPSGG